MKPRHPYNALRLFEQMSRESMRRNGNRCICEHEQRVAVKTKRMGDKMITLAQHGTVHLPDKHGRVCQHSELARTTQPDKPKPRKPARVFVTGE